MCPISLLLTALSSSGELYLLSISESKPPNKPGLALIFAVLYCLFACILTADIERKALFWVPLGSPFAFESADCLGTDTTKYGLQMLKEYLLTPREVKLVDK